MPAYYNEHDPYAAAWLRNLIEAGHIAPGDVDERSITDVMSDDLDGYEQVHLFAGIGGWSYAARLAGWTDNRPLWTGSCPCQPFSAAGKRRGTADARHLWPEMQRLISACRPNVVAGEQVASKDGRLWLSGVRVDLEDMAYGVWAADTCAAGMGAPHIRQRLYWLANAGVSGRRALQRPGEADGWPAIEPDGHGDASRLGDTNDARLQGRGIDRHGADELLIRHTSMGGWSDCDTIHCTDGKTRRAPSPESGFFPLAYGAPSRVGRLRAYGNAIVPQVAAQILGAYLDCVA